MSGLGDKDLDKVIESKGYYERGKNSTWFGRPAESLSREQLIAMVGWFGEDQKQKAEWAEQRVSMERLFSR